MRSALLSPVAVVVVTLGGTSGHGLAALPQNPIQIENARPGSTAWNAPAGPGIEGYASQISLLPGKPLELHVSTTPAARYRIEVFRIGWYGGAGGRLVACAPGCARDEQGTSLPYRAPDPDTGMMDPEWPATDVVTIPRRTVSGYFVAKLVLTSTDAAGSTADVPFIVRAPARRHAAVLVQAPVNTWQAYNTWGGRSLYAFNSVDHRAATRVSFNRPLAPLLGPGMHEYQLVRFLERRGYDVAYTTDVDTDRAPASLLHHELVISAGHDEYWTKRTRDAFEAARDGGTNLAFMGADAGDWQIRYADGRRTIVEYRSASADPDPNPATKTTRFAQLDPPRPPCQLVGTSFHGYVGSTTRFDYSVAPEALSDPWFRNTGFEADSTVRGVVGYEWDGLEPACDVPRPTVLFHYPGPPSADAVRYTAPSGAQVFSTGSLSFVWGLDGYRPQGLTSATPADARLQAFMENALNDLAHTTQAP